VQKSEQLNAGDYHQQKVSCNICKLNKAKAGSSKQKSDTSRYRFFVV
jgi:hypothetical protein